MDTTAMTNVRDELVSRRQQLVAVATAARSDDVQRLIDEVDAALARVSAGTFGLCETCHDPIEPDRLRVDPLLRFCLDHLTPVEQRALEHDLQLAARIQRELLPKPDTQYDGWDIAFHYQPHGPVSGDYCDIIAAPGGDTYFLLGDVAGKGVAAAMLMSHLSALLRTLVPVGLGLPELMARASRVFCESTLPAHYATLVCVRASRSGALEICNAGHPPPLVFRAGGVERVDATGLPIGMFCSERFASKSLRLADDDLLLLYSDGLIETDGAGGDGFGVERVAAVGSAAPRTARAVVGACLREVTAFGRPADDMTMLAVTRR